ncbi:MAG TPA: addiction module protein [Flavobacteriales bacterium]|nr:addiction module protein [Flavobacteriales bacterium]HMU14707.1 addiction module protein [Flavobacteriales bacterium]HMZ48184.1 addiction module protein [Flavobacteriales bacterium]HNI03650.1 addiction module protein [Flavobacteriales bacterium]HNK67555.1 addiction module protein [Flavobacteriales bacterium]
MSTESLKLQLIEHLLRTTDESLLKQVAALFRSAKGEEDADGLTDEQYSIVKERYEEYKRGEGKSYTWEEVREMARKSKKA